MKIEILNDGGLTCFKGNATLVEENELETFDNYIHEIAEEYCKITFKEKDKILTQRLIKKQEEEIKRLNNIIDELEKWLNDNENQLIHYDYESKYDYVYVDDILNKLKELKGDKE